MVVVQLEGEHTSIERQQMAGFARKDSLALRTLLIVLTERLAGAAGTPAIDETAGAESRTGIPFRDHAPPG